MVSKIARPSMAVTKSCFTEDQTYRRVPLGYSDNVAYIPLYYIYPYILQDPLRSTPPFSDIRPASRRRSSSLGLIIAIITIIIIIIIMTIIIII